MNGDDLAREATDRLLPPEPDAFFDDFWAHTARRERDAARRWRRTAVAVVALAVAAASAVAVAATKGSTKTIDETMTCRMLLQAGAPNIAVGAAPLRNKKADPYHPPNAQLMLSTALPTTRLVALDTTVKGYAIDRSLCHSGGSLALAPRGLPEGATLAKGAWYGKGYRCLFVPRVIVHLHAVIGSRGVPTSARLAVANAKTHRMLFYVDWSPARATMYAPTSCGSGNF